MNQLFETDLTVISEKTNLEGKLHLSGTTKISGSLRGEIYADTGSRVFVEENGIMEGKVHVDSIFISGAIIGDVHAKKIVHLTSTGRIIGTVTAPQFVVDFGGKFEGKAKTGTDRGAIAD